MPPSNTKYFTPLGSESAYSTAIAPSYFPFGPYVTPSASNVGFISLDNTEQFFTDSTVWSNQFIVTTGSNASAVALAVLANSTGTLSSYAWFASSLIQGRNLSDRFSNSSITAGFLGYLQNFRASSDFNDITNDTTLGLGNCGVIAVKKIKYGENIRPLYFQISSSAGVSFSNTLSADETFGIMTRDSDGASAGIVFYDLGVALIHGPDINSAQACSAVTAITLNSTYKIWQLNAFCTAGANQFSYPSNPSAFYISAIGDPSWQSSFSASGYGYQLSSGPNYVNSSSSIIETGGFLWKNLGNASAADGYCASTGPSGLFSVNDPIIWTNFSNFNLPLNASLCGIVVEINREALNLSSITGIVRDYSCKLYFNGSTTGSERAVTGVYDLWMSGSLSSHVYGSSSDLWGCTFIPIQINASGIGVAFQGAFGSTDTAGVCAAIDYARMTIYYSIQSGYQWGINSTLNAETRGNYYLNNLGYNWGPYVTSVGLYNISGDCLAVAKLTAPLRKPRNYPLTVRVALDFD